MTTSSPRPPLRPLQLGPFTLASQRISAAESRVGTRSDFAGPIHLLKRVSLVAVDMAAVNLAFYLAWFARYRMMLVVDLDPGNYVDHDLDLPLQLALSVVFVFILALRG